MRRRWIKTWALVAHTVRESVAKKTFIFFFVVSTLIHLFLIFAIDISVVGGAMAMVELFGKSLGGGERVAVADLILGIEAVIAVFFAFVGGIFFAIFATASLIPDMLERGKIEILLAKPMSRTQILLSRYVGAQLIMAANAIYLIGGSWLVLSLKTDFWHLPYLYAIPTVLAAFAFMYAFMTFVGVTTRSTGVSIMTAYAAMLFSALYAPNKSNIYAVVTKKVYYGLETIYHLLPKTYDLGVLTFSLVNADPADGWSALWTSGLTAVLLMTASCWIFSKKDF